VVGVRSAPVRAAGSPDVKIILTVVVPMGKVLLPVTAWISTEEERLFQRLRSKFRLRKTW
jgi:hypothetical protein